MKRRVDKPGSLGANLFDGVSNYFRVTLSGKQVSKAIVLRLDHILNAWPASNANLAVLRVSVHDFEQFHEELPPELRRPVFMQAPVECAPGLPAGTGIACFDTGDVRSVRIEWAEIGRS
jgi:hypothetical protein